MIFDPIIIKKGGSLPENLRTITVTADPPEGGSVSVGGMASDGTTLAVKSEPSEGYKFNNWQQNGEVLSSENPYIFVAQSDLDLCGTFAPSRVPAGCTEVEYIDSVSGSSYFTTDVVPSNDLKIEMDVEPLGDANDQEKYFFESSYFNYSASPGVAFLLRGIWQSPGVRANMGKYNTSSMTSIAVNQSGIARRMALTAKLSTGVFYVNNSGVEINNSTYSTSMNKLTLLSYSMTNSDKTLLARLYSCKIYKAGVLTHDFVPCIDQSGRACLYNLVTKKFLYGYGQFSAGPAV